MTEQFGAQQFGAQRFGAQRVAAIDCGTNSLRLLIADLDAGARTLTDVARRMEIVRLGQGVDATGKLAPEALQRTFRVLAEYEDQIRQAGAGAVRMVATSATRDASNSAEFAAGVQDILGVLPEVISGDEEARLSFTGATTELAPAPPASPSSDQPGPPYLVVDIGGGSTEFVLGDASSADLAAISVDIGCVRLTERYLHSDPPTAGQVSAATADIDQKLGLVMEVVPVSRARTLVGLAGSVTTVTAIGLGLAVYDRQRTHHARLPASVVHEVTERLLSIGHAERAAIPVLHPGRVDVIGAGALILDRVMQRCGFDDLVASEHDILDGIAWSLAVSEPLGRGR
jgi:exopolyphosphatase / guanosine-5'-triphosphate,3'-diphosphate pyrophosphatase